MSEAWHLISAKDIGTSHKESQTPCQDAFSCGLDATSQVLLLAIADGAGSCRNSDIGANFMCKRSIELINALIADHGTNKLAERIERDVIQQSIYDLQAYAESEKIPFSQLSSTFAFVAIHPEFMFAAQIGDSRLAIQRELCLGETVIGDLFSMTYEYANESDFTTDAEVFCQSCIIPNPQTIIGITAFTDGLDPIVVQGGTSFPGFFQPIFDRVRNCHSQEALQAMDLHLVDFLSSSQVNSRTDDDKTLLIASRCLSCKK